jgi:hypothetical protein
LKFPAIATVPLNPEMIALQEAANDSQSPTEAEAPLTIADAKRRLAAALGVDPANIKITVEA